MTTSTRPDLIKKWAPILEHEGLSPIKDKYRKEVTAVLLENQVAANKEQQGRTGLFEAAPANSGGTGIGGVPGTMGGAATGTVSGYDPILISLVRRAMPQMIAFDVCGVQPMTQPTGLIFAMKSHYGAQNGPEALYNEANTEQSGWTDNLFDGDAGTADTTSQAGAYPGATGYNTGVGMSTATKEGLATFQEMSFSIEKTHVVAKTRALKAEYSNELAQDLQAVHGLDAESELVNILSTEILAEINREVIRTIYIAAKAGAEVGTTTQGVFDLDTDSNGRWSAEKFKGLLFQIEREANAIGQLTRRGRGNFLICSADVASALALAGALDYAPALNTNLNVDDTSTTYAGILNSKMKVYIDPYSSNLSNDQFFIVGYKGPSAFDSGLFFCPYVPLQMVRAQDPNNFQPRIGFSTRYGMTANPFATTTVSDGSAGLQRNSNLYYRKCRVLNLS